MPTRAAATGWVLFIFTRVSGKLGDRATSAAHATPQILAPTKVGFLADGITNPHALTRHAERKETPDGEKNEESGLDYWNVETNLLSVAHWQEIKEVVLRDHQEQHKNNVKYDQQKDTPVRLLRMFRSTLLAYPSKTHSGHHLCHED